MKKNHAQNIRSRRVIRRTIIVDVVHPFVIKRIMETIIPTIKKEIGKTAT